MHGLFDSVAVKILASAVVAVILLFAYYALDIYLALTKRDYKNIEVFLMYLTRNDHGRAPDRVEDACQSRLFGPIVSIQDTYRNRFLFWSLILKALRAKPDEPLICFREDAEMFLRPIRGRITAPSARDEAKRAEGLPYIEGRYHFCMICDRSDDKRRMVLKVIMIRTKDLNRRNAYIANPPVLGDFALFQKIAEKYRKRRREYFLEVKLTLT